VLAPLLLHAVAWDTARIWTYTIVAAFGCLWLSVATDGASRAPARRWLLAAAVPLVVANVVGRSPLMDGQVERFSLATRLLLYLPCFAGAAVAMADGWRTRGASAR
jgi:cytochrome bd-type quinol oxidase subunit 2